MIGRRYGPWRRARGHAGSPRRPRTAAAAGCGRGGARRGVLRRPVVGESKLARRRIPGAVTAPPPSQRHHLGRGGGRRPPPPIRVAVLGDSSAAGYGVHRDRDTLAAQLAIGISAIARRPVHISNVAKVGAVSQDVPGHNCEPHAFLLGRITSDGSLASIFT